MSQTQSESTLVKVADDLVKASEHELVSILVVFGLRAAFDSVDCSILLKNLV